MVVGLGLTSGRAGLPETGRTTQGYDSGSYTTLSPAMPKPWAWAIMCMWGEGGGNDLPIADFSLESPSLPAVRSQAMTGRFRVSRPGCPSQPTTPLEADVRGPSRVSRCGSHPGQGQGSAWEGLSPGCLEPPSASLVFPPWQSKLAQNSHLQEGFSMPP